MKQLISIPEIAERFHADASLIRKRLKHMKIKTITAVRSKTKKSTTAISIKELKRLLNKHPSLSVDKAKVTDIPNSTVANKWKRDISTVLKMCASHKIKLAVKKIHNKSKSVAMRPVKTISKKDYNILLLSLNKIPRV